MKIRGIHFFIFLMGLLGNVAWSINPILIILPVTFAVIIQLFDMQQKEGKKDRVKE